VSSLFSIPHKQPSTNTIHFKAHTHHVCVCVCIGKFHINWRHL